MRSPFVRLRAGKNTLSRLVTATSRSPTRTRSLCAECGHDLRDARHARVRTFGAGHRFHVLLARGERERVEPGAQPRRRQRPREIAWDDDRPGRRVRFERHASTLAGRELRCVADLLARGQIELPAVYGDGGSITDAVDRGVHGNALLFTA